MSTTTPMSNSFCKSCGYPGYGVHYAGCKELAEWIQPTAFRAWTEDEIRRIVREELERARAREGKL